MNMEISRDSCVPVYQQIADNIAQKILEHELCQGFKLPPERKLAAELSVHRNTVIKAYNQLIIEDLVVVSRETPKGYFVKSVGDAVKFGKRFFPLEKPFQFEFHNAEKTFNDIYWQSCTNDYISFGGIVMNNKIDPVKNMEAVTKKIFDVSGTDGMWKFYDETETLKKNICTILAGQNIYVSTKNVQIFSESTHVIGYLMMMYLREGDCIVAEGPMVPDYYSIFNNRKIHVIDIPMEHDGMKIDMLEEALRKYKPKFIYTIPNYHNPTGISMSLKKRRALLNLANIYNVPVIEEDYQWDFAYEKKLPSLYTLDTNKLVIYLNSFTLTFPYMVKIGYAVGPTDLVDMMGYAVSTDETMTGGIGQFFLNEYISSGQYKEHIQIMQHEYKQKLDLLCDCLDKIADKGISYIRPKGGLFVWCTLEKNINDKELYKIAKKNGILVMPGWVFYNNNREKSGNLRLCFSKLTDQQIKKGTRILGKSLDEIRPKIK